MAESPQCPHGVAEGVKCADCERPVSPAIYFAESWDEIEDALDAEATAKAVADTLSLYRGMVDAILRNPDTSSEEKAARLQAATVELADRLAEPEQAAKAVGILGRLAERVGLKQDEPTKTEGGVRYRASDYADVPDPEKPSTWKLRLAEGRSGRFTVAQVARAITALQPGGFRGNPVELGTPRTRVIARISRAIGQIEGASDAQKARLRERLAAVKAAGAGAFRVYKGADGRYRWLAVYSNALRDREGDVIPEAEHKAFVAWADATGNYPELWLWHTPGTRLGQADVLDVADGFALAGGYFDADKEGAARALARLAPDLGVSHGFTFEERTPNGELLGYRTREISPLPRERAANLYTGLLIQEEIMSLSDEKRQFLADVMGPDAVRALEEGLAQAKAAAEDAGLAFKDVLEGLDLPAVKAEGEGAGEGAADDTSAAASDSAGAGDGDAQADSGEGDGDADAQDKAAAMPAYLEPLVGAVKALAERVKALEEAQVRAEDVKSAIAEAMTPRHGAYIASHSGDNVVHGNTKEARALREVAEDAPFKEQLELLERLATAPGPMVTVVDDSNQGG